MLGKIKERSEGQKALHNRMYEIVDEKELKRFAVITYEDTIFWDSADILECERIFWSFGGTKTFKGIYDYKQGMYLDEVDILDIVGCQIHSED